eukprot:3188098-Pleurochrysis_carterae.AAC.2
MPCESADTSAACHLACGRAAFGGSRCCSLPHSADVASASLAISPCISALRTLAASTTDES